MKKRLGMIAYIAIFLVVEVLFGYFILESRNVFVENSIKDGGYLAQAQADQIEAQLDKYGFSVELAGKYLDQMLALHTSEAEIQQWMKSYCDKIADQFGNNVVDLYGVLNGRIVAANPWEGDEDYDFASQPWYTATMEAEPGTIVFSNLYKDAITGQNVFTMAMALSDTGNVVAIDVYLTSGNWMGLSELPSGYGLMVYDPHQTLAYSMGYTHVVASQGDVLDHNTEKVAHYTGFVEEGYNLYTCKLSGGWSVVVAIPEENLISSNHMFWMDLGLGLNVLNMMITTVFLVQHLRNSRYIRQDTLTGLFNKAYLIKQIRNRLKKTNGTLLIADLDNFKKLNDSYGHDHGDLVIIQVAEIMKSCFRKTDCIGRFGGDEFVIYVDTLLTEEVLNTKTQELIHQVEALAQQYPLSELTISIGGCHCKKGDRYIDVFKRADEALYKVKNSGKRGFSMNHDREKVL